MRAKEETEAIMNQEQTHDRETHGRSDDIDESTPTDQVKAPNVFERAKEEIEALVETFHSKKEHNHEKKDEEKIHERETHGTSDDIDENTPVDKVKGPNMFERAKEEIEALVEAIHPKKGPDH
ncbi:uncharacterized protein [Typha angustifolia]|uniref:uncharacterized protein n=1 Tax=Typha angustifolia TaxID=59011 RepID=UPI003C2BABBA